MDKNLKLDYKFGFRVPHKPVYTTKPGISEKVVEEISYLKEEPKWMRDFRLKAFKIFRQKEIPKWGPDLSSLKFEDITYYVKPTKDRVSSWEDLPLEIKKTYDLIGIPEAEKKFLAGVSAQFESEVVYENIKKDLEKKGVIFCDMDTGLRKYPEIVKEYFGKLVPPADNKFAALNSAVWSGGSFVFVPKGVKLNLPLQAYFRINAERIGQFERTLIIAEEGSYVHYVEGCLPAGEKVSCGDSWVNVESIKPGDFVINQQGKLSKVKKVMVRKYRGPLYKISPISTFNSFSLTPEHPVLVIKREDVLVKRKRRKNWLPEVDTQKLKEKTPEFIEVKNLKKGDFLVFPKIKETSFKKSSLSDEEIEFLGFYTAEGSAYYHKTLKQYVVSLSFSAKEKNNIERVKELIKRITKKEAFLVRDPKKHAIYVGVYSEKLYNLCLYHCGKMAEYKKLSSELMNLPPAKIQKFFEGYFKGDGNLCLKSGKSRLYRFATASYHLAVQLQEILARLGIYASIKLIKGGKDKILGREIQRKDQYIVAFTKPNKWSEVRETKDYFLVPIKKIEKVHYDGYVFNLETDNTYLVKGFVVHNCTAPIYSTNSLHAAVVEIFVKRGARVRYTTIQNWSKNVFNLVTKRAKADEESIMEWVDCNIGSAVTMKYPSVFLVGRKSRAETLSLSYAFGNQIQDTGAKMIHLAPETSSRIISKSVATKGGRTSYRGLVQVLRGAKNSSVYVSCDALILDKISRSDTYPTMKIFENNVQIQHEATVEKIGQDKLFYFNCRGIKKEEAESLLVNGFIQPISKELPLEYAIELNRLINLQMEGTVG